MGTIEKEMQSLHKNQTWELVEILKRKRAIGASGCTRRNKRFQKIKGEKFKARLVEKVTYRSMGLTMMRYFLLWLDVPQSRQCWVW